MNKLSEKEIIGAAIIILGFLIILIISRGLASLFQPIQPVSVKIKQTPLTQKDPTGNKSYEEEYQRMLEKSKQDYQALMEQNKNRDNSASGFK